MAADIFRPSRKGAAAVLGPLEGKVLEVIWRTGGAVGVPEVHRAVNGRKGTLSYSAVKAVLNNLAEKGHLAKTRQGKVTHFEAVRSREEFDAKVIATVVGSLKRNFGTPMIAQLVDELAVDEATLQEFERVIAAKKAGRKT
jgi:predicted transcriptional regulator